MIKKIIISIIILLTIFVSYKVFTFEMFDDEFKMIEEIKLPNKDYSIRIFYIPSNASSQSYIQVREAKDNIETVLHNYERYNYLENYEIDSSSILKLTLSDTSFINVSSANFEIQLN